MGERAWQELSDEELDDLERERQALREEVEALTKDREALSALVEALRDAREDAQYRLEALCEEPFDHDAAADRLLSLLDRQLGFERLDDMVDVHDLFNAMRDLRTSLSEQGRGRRAAGVGEAFQQAENDAGLGRRERDWAARESERVR